MNFRELEPANTAKNKPSTNFLNLQYFHFVWSTDLLSKNKDFMASQSVLLNMTSQSVLLNKNTAITCFFFIKYL